MSGKHCGPSKELLDLDTKIGSAMDDLQNSSIGTGAAGIADSISGLKANLKSKTDGILADIESAIPEIPKPKASLQEQMTKLISNLDNPGVMLSELEGIKQNFGGTINIDDMLSKAGVDPSKMESLSGEFKDLQRKAKLQKVGGALGKLATGDLSAVQDLMGGVPSITLPGNDSASILDSLCKDVPTLEIIENENKEEVIVEKGTETKVATEDAEPVEEPSEKNDTPPPQKEEAPADKIKESKTVIVDPNTEAAAKIEKERTEEYAARYTPVRSKYKEAVFKAREFEKKAEKARNKKTKKNELRLAIEERKKVTALGLQTSLIGKVIDYEADVKKAEAGLRLRTNAEGQVELTPPDEAFVPKPQISYQEVHEKTNFSNFSQILKEIEALPHLVITGEKPKPVDFGS